MKFNAADAAGLPRTPHPTRVVADALAAGYTVHRIFHVTDLPTDGPAARIDPALERLELVIVCPLAEHGRHPWR